MNITELHPALHAAAQIAHALASRQSRPAYVVLGLRAQVFASFPGVWCMRVHPDGAIDPMCITA